MKRPKDRLHRVIVIGATPSGIAAAGKLGELGIPVTLVDSDTDIDKKLSNEKWKFSSGVGLNYALRPHIIRLFRDPGLKCILPASVESIKHSNQGFRVGLTREQVFLDTEKCVLCGKCVKICPVLQDNGKKAIWFESRQSLPGRAVIDKRQIPVCRENCPLGVNTQGYIALAKEGRFAKAFELIREENVLPGICGRICTHPCEKDCRRNQLDDSISIKDIKRFLSDWGSENQDQVKGPKLVKKINKEFAVIGSGPAGLAASAKLALHGCGVTLFEKEKEIGGLLRYGIGSHRLPRNVLDTEIDYIKKLGVKFKTSSNIDLNKDLKNLNANFDAVIVSTGAWKDRKLNVKGEDLKGIDGCISFLTKFHKNKKAEVRGKVAVIGDGNAAYDLARILSRISADVTIVSWFSKNKIPADAEEVREAEIEGIKLKESTQVVEFLGKKGRLSALLCRQTKPGEPDKNGIRWPVIVEDSDPFELEFDLAFIAIGQTGPLKKAGFKINSLGYIETDDHFKTSVEGIYAAGDAKDGPNSVVQAMASGKSAAIRVLSDIAKIEAPALTKRSQKDFCEIPSHIPTRNRSPIEHTQPLRRKNNFTEVSLGLRESQAIYEAERCLQCAVCSECMECVKICDAIDHFQDQELLVEHAGVIIIADPDITPQVKGDDVIRAYGPKKSGQNPNTMIMRGLASAAKAMRLLSKTSQSRKGRGVSFSHPEPGLSPDIRIGVFVCKCKDSFGWPSELDQYIADLNKIEEVFHTEVIEGACVPAGTAGIIRKVREKGITRIVLASCICCPLNFVCCACTDQRSRLKQNLFTATGISRAMVETCNIRGEALSLMSENPALAKERFKGLIERAIKRAGKLKPFFMPVRTYNFTTAVIGSSEAALNSAITLAGSGIEVFFFSHNIKSDHPNIHNFDEFTVKKLSGTLGDFQLTIQKNSDIQTIQAGAVILGEKSRKKIEYTPQERFSAAIVYSSPEKQKQAPFLYPGMTSIAGLFLADPAGINISKKQKGAAAAAMAAAIIPYGPRQTKGFTATIDQRLCRGCGRCMKVCPYHAITLKKREFGLCYAFIDEAFCRGCGNCISVCPSNAADKPYRDHSFLQKLLEEILLK